jgi:hypothetical protein
VLSCFRTVLRKEALEPCIVGKYQKKVEFYGYPNLFFPIHLIFCRSSLSLIVATAHLSDVLIAADSLRRFEPATPAKVQQHYACLAHRGKVLTAYQFSAVSISTHLCLDALHLKLAP